ncbi:MAG: stage sporulation protein [Clostridiales bacterium]|jgi:stage II sporulation protein E|nr:stage sporulation protein [Clostridiales bacterium]
MVEKTELFTYQRISNRKKQGDYGKRTVPLHKVFSARNILINLTAFMLGRATILSGITPFGLPFYAAVFTGEVYSILIGISIAIGLMTVGIGIMSLKYITAMILFIGFNLVNKNKLMEKTFFTALTAAGSLFICGMVLVVTQGYLLYDMLMLLFESFICFVMVFIFRTGLPIFTQRIERRILSNEEIISLSILLGLVILGFTDVRFPGGLSLRNILCIFVLLVFSLKHGVGVAASTGVSIGLINSIASPSVFNVIGSYAFSGLVAGIFRTFGKIGVSLGFILANAILTIYINGSTEVLINIYDIFIAIILLSILPAKTLDYVGEFLNKNPNKLINRKTYSRRIKEVTVDKLNAISKSFEQLANTFNSIAQKKTMVNNNDVASLFDQVADRVCKDCGLCLSCWEREFHNTYQVMFKILEKLEAKGHIDEKDLPRFFADRCIRVEDFVNSINNMFEICKVNLIWHNKVGESRGLVSLQLQGVAKIIANLANEITIDLQFDEDLERELMVALDKEGIATKDIIVLENSNKKYEVEIIFKACGGTRKCVKNAVPVISKVLGRKMTKQDSVCGLRRGESTCSVKYIEEEVYRVAIGISRAKKQGQAECGDNYSFMQLKDGKYILALSDGMGSGKKASRESSATIALLEQFLDSGFDKDTAVKLINSVLILKSPEDSFTTIDLSVVDLYNGHVEFVKIGAASTFIKRQDRIEVVKSTSLPVGILNHIDMELSSKTVADGDYIIMMSDGVLDSKADAVKKEEWVKDVLSGMNTKNPQEIADTILGKAIENSGNHIADDMTVLVAKVWKKI